MSDYDDDDMDVDAPAAHDEIMFSSNNASSRGKRSAANLPVEAEDSLPWYAPQRVRQAIGILMVVEGSKSTVQIL
jgi:replication factor C subunit 3/5